MAQRILVIDDNPANLALVSAILQHAGYDVVEAETAEEGLASLPAQPPDLVLVDIALPGMDGLAFTRVLKAQPPLAHIPVIAVTAFAMKSDEQKALDAGCDGYVTKPIDVHALPGVVAQALVRGAAK